ncbi:hypothetical protein COX85_03585 [Candidatus Micrarchaeota archaeon CG_4_10_14_0_2_um_filter_55_9]|nr:MAG: hypothetical protein AUJ15_00580 [Candidatus Micrarchaeota archaeon CG1_02_55_41]PIO02081.1 MAG: hypothetical protein COT57_03930 [Candidatus Micrarchaeota archaeon CG09_land_8_20_14_0_10_55_25]PIZ91466.1 MAG: hypothetical protein COX85_03585 [Candidatus Micrarchaeota archaeon CG_4_10_14_0_2_um_filter_55_9]PJD01501.1 MAG: hypothetical protein COU38_00660 [Candidatus Micrarchaeota archaeon CG10_big_fil_rev_8_21_14_0_10_54_18]
MKKKHEWTKHAQHEGLRLAACFGAALFAFQLVARLLAALTDTAQIIVGFAGWQVPFVDAAYYAAAIAVGYILPAKASEKAGLTLNHSTLLLLVLGTAFVAAVLGAFTPLVYSLFFAVPGSANLAAFMLDPAYWAYSVGYGFALTAAFLCIGLLIDFVVKRK